MSKILIILHASPASNGNLAFAVLHPKRILHFIMLDALNSITERRVRSMAA